MAKTITQFVHCQGLRNRNTRRKTIATGTPMHAKLKIMKTAISVMPIPNISIVPIKLVLSENVLERE
jgi:hypothetical protein